MKRYYLVIDYETRSRANLKKVGAFEYSTHPSTEVLCVAWKWGTRESLRDAQTDVWAPRAGIGGPGLLKHLAAQLTDNRNTVVAHNAGFEQVVTRNVLWRHFTTQEQLRANFALRNIPIHRWLCTASLAAAHALPRKLEDVCDVLELPVRKDPMGKLLIQRHCKPRKPSKHNPSLWNEDPEGLARLAQYCATDVDAETELLLALPPLTAEEREVWKLNQRINTRGVHTDRPLVVSVLGMIKEESALLEREAKELTGGRIESATQRNAVVAELERFGLTLPNLQRKTVEDAIATGLATGKAKRLLEIRLAISKTSTAKYLAFEERARFDGRVRDLQLYHGASTGRESGTGVQPHNFPRGTLEDPETAISALKTSDLEWVRVLYGDPMAAFSSCLRGVLAATPGHTMYCADFNAIEARVVFWLARHDTGLELFTSGEDPYKDQATQIYSKPLNQITPEEREVGKRAILGCGFGMGHKKFRETCKLFGMPISEALAKRAVEAYRTKHAPVVKLWSNLEKAAIYATVAKGKKSFTVNRTRWFVSGKFLYCELPSGRRLAYYGPEVRYEKTPWGERRPRLYHWGVNSLTKKWECGATYGGALCENVTQAGARDLMVAAQLRTEWAGYIPLISVHDELLAECKNGVGSLSEFEALMAKTPAWAGGLPVKVKGWVGARYRK